jgi:flagellar biosynthesis/type III secretory pathway protein FliH
LTEKQWAAGYDRGFIEGYLVGAQDGYALGYDEGTEALAAEVRER